MLLMPYILDINTVILLPITASSLITFINSAIRVMTFVLRREILLTFNQSCDSVSVFLLRKWIVSNLTISEKLH